MGVKNQKITTEQFNQLRQRGFTIRIENIELSNEWIRRWYFNNGLEAVVDDYPSYQTWDNGPVGESNIYYVLHMQQWLWNEINPT